ncbi:hypothetical protein [Bradyrhizobium sp. Leo170]|uniref:hypothetical protein n=1 Tax=Bradyrhizobium sp. Leo170 TaxID=1571199 RepID=UPI00102E9CB7|nr:hypothetical protein [Bradyrhizobium sp. Leo170]TAI67618.1 hypothetical protein CWO89_02035 [Bradyrhizobium sp. Leo170]
MSMLLATAPEFASAAALARHYAAVRSRMPRVVPPTPRPNPFLPKPVIIMLPPPTDIVPDQRRAPRERVARLTAEAEQTAIRRAISAYFDAAADTPLGYGTKVRMKILHAAIAGAFKVGRDVVLQKSRWSGSCRIRLISIGLAHRLVSDSPSAVGIAFGVDHSCVWNARRRVGALIEDILVEMYDGASCSLGGRE